MIVVEQAGPGVTVQDHGRPGHQHEGVPPGGALVPELLRASNQALGNDEKAAAIEVPSKLDIRATKNVTVAINGAPRALQAGESIEIAGMAYLAVPGGIDVPIQLGGRGTLLVAHLGRALRNGDEIKSCLDAPVSTRTVPVDFSDVIRAIPGPDRFSDAALEAFFNTEFRVGPADRVGMRLTGARLPVDGADVPGSLPLVRGAIQVTHDGTPIVLGPDHPTTGGYRVIAVVHTGDLGALARRHTGSIVRFTRA